MSFIKIVYGVKLYIMDITEGKTVLHQRNDMGYAPEGKTIRAGFQVQDPGKGERSIDVNTHVRVIVLEDLFDVDTETAGYAEREVQARDVFTFFDGENCLTGDANGLC